MNMYACVLMACMVAVSSAQWLNDFDQPLAFTCPSGQAITRIRSEHSNGAEDRRFQITCSALPVDVGGMTLSCAWTANYINDLDQPAYFECDHNKFLSGMRSIHNNDAEDRRFKFYCCSYPSVHLTDCSLTGWTNNFDQESNYAAPTGMLIKSVFSEHNNGAEDRRFRYEVCTVQQSDGGGIVGR